MVDKHSIQERFEQFAAANPEVEEEIVRYARQAKAKGFAHVGIDLIWSRLRWFAVETATRGKLKYRFPNDYRSRYARRVNENYPDLRGFFKTRMLKSQ